MKIDSTKREYQHLKDFYTEVFAQVTSTQGEARVLHPAIVSVKPVQPIKVYHVGLTALLGLLLSTGLVYVLDFLNVRAFFSSGNGKNTETSKLSAAYPNVEQASLLLEELARNMAAKGGSVYLRKKDSLVLAKALDPGHAPAVIPLPLRQGSILELAMTTGEPVLIQDIEKESSLTSSGWKGYNDRSLLVLPIPDENGEIIGIISLHNKNSPPFTPQDRETQTTLLASHVSKIAPKGTPENNRRHLHIVIRYPIIALCGICISMLVFYILNKLGY